MRIPALLRELPCESRQEIEDAAKELTSTMKCLGVLERECEVSIAACLNAVVSEIYSPPKVTSVIKTMPRHGLEPGFSLDLATTDEQGRPWDFDKAE